MCKVEININGGNNQILPNATHATQNFYGNSSGKSETIPQPEEPQTLPDAEGEPMPEALLLTLYINKENLNGYLAQIAECRSASELAMVVVNMKQQEPRLTAEEIVKERFIKQILFFARNLQKGATISNIRARINDAWEKRPKNSK